jgi:hypothetical protein
VGRAAAGGGAAAACTAAAVRCPAPAAEGGRAEQRVPKEEERRGLRGVCLEISKISGTLL